MNFSSKSNYKKWLGYVHATGLAEKTPGHQPVSIKGKTHKVKHKTGGLTKSEINLTKALESLFGGKDVFPQKFPDGGPILPITPTSSESTAVTTNVPKGTYTIPNSGAIMNTVTSIGETINYDILGNKPATKPSTASLSSNYEVAPLPEGYTNDDRKAFNRMKLGLDPDKITPRHSKFRYRERAYGGQTEDQEKLDQGVAAGNAISSTLSAIPGFGPILGGIAGIGTMAFATAKKEDMGWREQMRQPVKQPENIYGTFKDGGFVNSNFKQYNTGSHDSGMDQGIDSMGNPNNNADGGYIQNQENAYKFDDTAYVMSDTLINPETGNYFNQDAARLNKKYKKADYVSEEKNALEFGMSRLTKLNDTMRNIKEQVLKACGGSTKKFGGGLTQEQMDNARHFYQPPTMMTFREPEPTRFQHTFQTAKMGLLKAYDKVTNKYADGGEPVDPRFKYTVNTETTPLETFNDNLPYSFSTPVPTYSILDQGIATDPTSMGTQIVTGRNLSEPTGSSKKSTKLTTPKVNANDIAIALKGAGLIGTIAAAARPAEKETPILSNYDEADKQMYLANIDYTQARQDALAAANLASNVNRSAGQSFGQYQGRQAMNYANLADQLGNISMQENNQRSQLALTRSQYEANKSVDDANRLYQNRIDNLMNQATADLADEKLFSELTQIGTTFNEYQYYKDALTNNKEIATAKIKEAAAVLGNKYENFGFSEDFIEKLKNQDYDNLDFEQAIKFIATADQIKKAKKT